MTKRRRHTPEQVARKLVAADRLLAGGADTAEVARTLAHHPDQQTGVTPPTPGLRRALQTTSTTTHP